MSSPAITTTTANLEEKKVEEPLSLEEQQGAFADTLFQAVLGAQMTQTAYLGHKLGWYSELKAAGEFGLTASELAIKTDSSQRYAQEWLEQQAVGAWIRCDNPRTAVASHRRFVLPAAHVSVLADPDSLSYLIPFTVLQGGAGKLIDELVHAYKNDKGVSWEMFGNDAREANASLNRPFYLQQFPSIIENIIGAETAEKLKTKGGRIADIGAGYAWSSVGVAKHFGACRVDAYDLDAPSVDQATKIIKEEGVDDRVKAHCIDAGENLHDKDFEPCDLVMALECVHDMSDPISVLKTMRGLASGSGTVVVMDEKCAEDFGESLESGSPYDQALYGISCVCCLADSKSHPNSVATGTLMRPSVLRAFAQQAGFKNIVVVQDVDNDFFRFYKLIG